MNVPTLFLFCACLTWTAASLRGAEPATREGAVNAESLRAIRRTMLQLHNAERKSQDLEPLQENAELHQAAQRHAAWMAANEQLTHAPEDEPTPDERIQETGYPATNWGENIA